MIGSLQVMYKLVFTILVSFILTQLNLDLIE